MSFWGRTALTSVLKDKLPKRGGATNPFIDPAGYKAYVEGAGTGVRERAHETDGRRPRRRCRRLQHRVGSRALSVPNIAETIAWYEKMLGFKGTVRNGQPGARQQVADFGAATSPSSCSAAGRRPLAGVEEEPVRRFPYARREALRVRSVDLPAVLAELKAKGVKMALRCATPRPRPLPSSATTRATP